MLSFLVGICPFSELESKNIFLCYFKVENLFRNWKDEFQGLQLIMAVLPGKDKDLYAEIKRVGDSVVGIPTQCVQLKLVQQAKDQVCVNISLKINSKLGGINQVIDPSVKSPVFREPTIVFGADVTHPSPTKNDADGTHPSPSPTEPTKSNGIPSIAAVVASMDANATKYQARVRAQRHEKGRGAQEIINDLAAIVRELLIEFYKANGKLKPSKIIFYRDGVSEGQFDQVLAHEVRAVQEACMKLEKEYRPRITFIVVQKRHHTRLFCENSRDETGKIARNIPPGTTVDSGITHPYEFDFYLCSHFGIQVSVQGKKGVGAACLVGTPKTMTRRSVDVNLIPCVCHPSLFSVSTFEFVGEVSVG